MFHCMWIFRAPSLTIRPAPRSKEGNEDGIECPFRKKDRRWLTASTFSSRDKGWGVNLSTKAAGAAAFVDSPRRNRNIATSPYCPKRGRWIKNLVWRKGCQSRWPLIRLKDKWTVNQRNRVVLRIRIRQSRHLYLWNFKREKRIRIRPEDELKP